METLQDWLAHCERLHPKTIDTRPGARAGRGRGAWACASTCPVITVAGTNGKGSTCAMLEAIALQAGYRTGVYTSPHLVHFEERCRIHGEIVRRGALVPHFEAWRRRAQGDVADLLRIHHARDPEPAGRIAAWTWRSWRSAWAAGWTR